LDKSHGGGLLAVFADPVNSVLCQDAFAKEAVIRRMAEASPMPVILLDFDQLFTGYVNSGMLARDGNVRVYTPARDSWPRVFREVASLVSTKQTVLIVDSLNGFFSVFDGRDSGRYANSCMMMLASCARGMGGKTILCGVARIREGEGWILHPTGRRAPDADSVSKFFVRRQDGIRVESLSRENRTEKTFHL